MPDSPQTVRHCDKNIRFKGRSSQTVFSEHGRDDPLGIHIHDAVGVQPQLRDDRQAYKSKGHKGDAQLRFTATRTRCWSDSKYDYTETNYYSVRRDGTLGFDAVPVDGSSKIEDDLMESIEPFAMQDAIPFQTAYLAGYVADKYDVSAEDGIERANKRIRRSTEETFQQTVTGYDSVKVDNSSIQLHGGKAKYALFPVWLLSTSWRGENYLFAMNGQTGRFVGDLPVDKGAARKWMLGLTAALSAASYGVMWLLWLARIL